jgi:hypothetical protein
MSIADIEAAELPEETARHIERVRKNGYDRFKPDTVIGMAR